MCVLGEGYDLQTESEVTFAVNIIVCEASWLELSLKTQAPFRGMDS